MAIRKAAAEHDIDLDIATYLFNDYWRVTAEALTEPRLQDIQVIGLCELRCDLDAVYHRRVLYATRQVNCGVRGQRSPKRIQEILRFQRLIPRMRFERLWRKKRYKDIINNPLMMAMTLDYRDRIFAKDKSFIK